MKASTHLFPYIRSSDTTSTLMLDTIIALIPPFFMAYFYYGFRTMVIGAVSVAVCFLANLVSGFCLHRHLDYRDLSPIVTGMLIALMMPASIPFYVPVTAAIFAVLVAKFPYGGTGNNLFNPAAVGLAFAVLCFSEVMSVYTAPLEILPLNLTENIKLIQGPASILKMGGVPSISTTEMLLGNFAGPMGTTNILVVCACLLYLFVRKNITWYVPAVYLGTVSLFAVCIHADNITAFDSIILEMITGSLVFVAAFFLNDPVTQPKRPFAKLLYGVTAGVLTMVFRYYANGIYGVIFAIILANALSPALDQVAQWKIERERRVQHEAE